MTKRAGKKKNRNPTSPPPGSPQSVQASLVEERLSSVEAIMLELRALREGWLLGDKWDNVRGTLLAKVAKTGLESKDDLLTLRIVRTLAMTEHRQKEIALRTLALELRAIQGKSDLPPQDVPAASRQPASKPKYLIIQELYRDREVRAALDNRSPLAIEASAVRQSQVSDRPAS